MPAWQDEDMDRYSPTVRRRRLGLALRRHREAHGWTLEDAATKLGVGPSQLSKYETADRNLPKPTLLLACSIYQISDPERAELVDMHAQSRARGWWQDLSIQPGTYVDFEAEATSIQSFDLGLIPGILQTDAYAEAIMSATRPDATPKQLEDWRKVRTSRVELLADDGPKVWSVIHEAALWTMVGGPEVMVEQLRHIAKLAETRPGLEVQVLPFTSGQYAGMEGSFSILTFDELPSLGYTEGATSGVWLEKQKDITTLTHAFGLLISQALNQRKSLARLEKITDWMAQGGRDLLEEVQP